jgi:hypothetical protein
MQQRGSTRQGTLASVPGGQQSYIGTALGPSGPLGFHYRGGDCLPGSAGPPSTPASKAVPEELCPFTQAVNCARVLTDPDMPSCSEPTSFLESPHLLPA